MAHSILIAEDNIAAARVLERALVVAGYQVAVVANGLAALEVLRQSRFDAVLTDIRMPHMDGQELCERIRAERLGGEPLLFVLSSLGEEDLVAWTRALPRVEFVPKPVSARKLIARLEERLADDERGGGDTA